MRSKFKWIYTLLIALTMQLSFAQGKTVSGVVTDASGALPFVNVVVKGTSNGVQTDLDGKYSITAKPGDVLVFSFVGMSDFTAVVGNSSTINAKMVDGVLLDDVVITTDLGYFKKAANTITSGISVVSGEELTRQAPNVSVENALQGKAAGVQVTSLNGQPGQRAYVSVRGSVGITSGNANAVYVVDGAFVSAGEFTAIAAADVETVTVLKDGAAAAIYGVKGGNGVVVVTTKRGSATGKTKFQVSNSFGFTNRIEDPYRMMNAAEKIAYEEQLGEGPAFGVSPAERNLLLSYDHDWKEDLLREGYLQNFDFSVSGGSEKMTHYLSVGYNKNTGIIDGMKGYDRITGRYSSDFQANEWLKTGVSIGASYETNTAPRDRNNVQNPFRAMYDYNPYETLYDRDPLTGEVIYDLNGDPVYSATNSGLNIAEATRNNTSISRTLRTYVRPYLELTLYKDLVFNTKFSMNYERRQGESFTKPGSQLDLILNGGKPVGQKTDSGWDNFEYQWTNTLSYKFNFNEAHNFGVILLQEYYNTNYRSYAATRKGFANPNIDVGGGTTPLTATSAHLQTGTISYFGNIDYDFKERYLLSLYARRDGSSRIGENNRWSVAKGASVGWNITKEDFFQVKGIDLLKFRASYGELNSTAGTTSYNAQIAYACANYAGQSGTTILGGDIGNPDLKFEKAEKLDLGFDAQFFKNRLALSGSYFEDKRNDFLYDGSSLNGTTWDAIANVGDWTSKGYEFEAKGFIIKKKDMGLSVYANFAQFDRKINLLDDPGNPTNAIPRGFTINQVGYAPDTFYLIKYAGVDPTNGDALYYAPDGSVTNDFSQATEELLEGKTPYAKYEGGFGLEFNYKGFDVSGDFVFKSGNYAVNLRNFDHLADGSGGVAANQDVRAFDYWTPENTDATLPAPYQLNGGVETNYVTDRFLEDASYIRWRNLNVGYTFSGDMFKQLPLDKVRIYCTIQNLATWTKFDGDPEIGIGNNEASDGSSTTESLVPGQFLGYSYPTVKTVLFGLTVNF
ncbi:SusC/RagA family TonB-linked outer membrane protein [Flavobacterium ardleyense]|uniref:SusC/RagA family TonB-linked outer membrane protein n=1 Tax=Flavobacterium ardleyense TaxID=2038737 RepID=UPI00298C2834|nr:SusC/RagA family TonB-linked outer membrane protein [Flavobacterium ardleyense]